MKKTLIALTLALSAAVLSVSLTACVKTAETDKDDENGKDQIENGDVNGETGKDDENTGDDKTDSEGETDKDDENGDGEASQTLAETLAGIFQENAADAESAKALADKIIEVSELPIGLVSADVSEGLLTGFGNTEITGFSEGAMFSPMIGSIPFIGYIFVLPEDADAEAFTTVLSDNADLRWNICVTADEMKIDTNGNKVFFVMCPTAIEEE